MTNPEAKFILNAYRPSGADAQDGAFAEAVGQAERDPQLKAWWDRTRTFDAAVAAGLREVAPPPGLRDSILAGARLSRRTPAPPVRRPSWFAMAASVVLLAMLVALLWKNPAAQPALASAFGEFALADMNRGGHIGDPDEPTSRWLSMSAAPLDQGGIPVDIKRMQAAGCRTLRFHGYRVVEVCFTRSGLTYHLYLLPRRIGPADPGDIPSTRMETGHSAVAVWSDAKFLYAVAVHGGEDALQKLL